MPDKTLQLRRLNTDKRGSVTPAAGEPVWDKEQKCLYVGDGTSTGGVFVGNEPQVPSSGKISLPVIPEPDTSNILGMKSIALPKKPESAAAVTLPPAVMPKIHIPYDPMQEGIFYVPVIASGYYGSDTSVEIDWYNGATQCIIFNRTTTIELTCKNPVEGRVYRIVIKQNGIYYSNVVFTDTYVWSDSAAPDFGIDDYYNNVWVLKLIYVGGVYYASAESNVPRVMQAREYISTIDTTVTPASCSVDWRKGSTQLIQLTTQNTNITLESDISVLNYDLGQVYRLIIQQDSVGSRLANITVSGGWPYIKWAGGVPPVLTTTPNRADIITILWFGSRATYYCDCNNYF